MRSMKKIFALAMVVMMLFAFAVINASAEEADYTEAAQRLSAINVLKGDTSGNLMLTEGVTRYQAALFFVQALTGNTEVEKWNADKQSVNFTDVPEYGTAIDYAYGIGLILGRGNGVYGYNDAITYQDMLVMAVRALGYETETTVYPYGYIETAKKLELTEGIEGVNYTDALTRGATAQIIWNMLNTYIAVEDPLTGKLIYPDDIVALQQLLETVDVTIERTTLLEEAGFSLGVIEAVITEFVEAESSEEVNIVVLDNGFEIAASELGITTRTNKATFLGLPVTIYIDCEVEDFEQNYDAYDEDNDATILFTEFYEFVNVVNVAEGGNIKVWEKNNEQRLTLGESTFRVSKYEFELYTLNATDDSENYGWIEGDFDEFCEAFAYDDKNGYTGTNSYGEVDYNVRTEVVDGKQVSVVMILYKPYEFGQYFTRSIRYQPTVTDESFITIGKYSGTVTENMDGDDTYFVETVLGSTLVVNSDTSSISQEDGEVARDTRLSGESVRSGDFIFYYYNELDNVLEIGYNCGTIKKGNLKSYSNSKETLKIDSTTYDYGFEGAFEHDLPEFDDFDFQKDFLEKLDNTEHNIQYVATDSNVIFAQTPLNTSNYRVRHNYVITTTDPEIMAELLNLEYEELEDGTMDPDCDYARKLTADGVYVSDKGNMTIAVLNTSTGKWGLGEVAQYEYGNYRSSTGLYHNGYVHKEAEWGHVYDVAAGIEKYDIFGTNFKNYAEYELVRDILLDGGMFAVRANNSGVYNLSVMFHPDDWGMIPNGKVLDGLYFSDAAPKTNALVATRASGTEAKRVTLTDSTVIVVVGRDADGHNQVGVRVGIQGEEDSIVFNGLTSDVPAYCYSASNKLIVIQLPLGVNVNMTTTVTDIDGNPLDIKAWGEAESVDASETYYIATNGAGIEHEKLDDDTYDVTVSGLFNLRTMRAVSAIKVNIPDVDDTNLINDFEIGAILHMQENGDLVVVDDITIDEALLLASDLRDSNDDDFTTIDMTAVEFVDEDSITIEELGLEWETAVGEINMTVATLDLTDLKTDKYDLKKIAFRTEYDPDNEWGAGSVKYAKDELVFAYGISGLNVSETINAPTAGVLNQYIIDTVGEIFHYAKADVDYFEEYEEILVDLYGCARFDEKTGEVTVYVVKVVVEN